MKLSVTRDSLHAGLGAVAATIPSKTTLPVLSNILLEAKDGGLTLSGTDLDISVSVTIDAEIEQDFTTPFSVERYDHVTGFQIDDFVAAWLGHKRIDQESDQRTGRE